MSVDDDDDIYLPANRTCIRRYVHVSDLFEEIEKLRWSEKYLNITPNVLSGQF